MLAKGDIVDRYRLEERLGAGTFGEVWRVAQLTQGQDVGRTCAIKMMRLARANASAVANGWLDEVRALQLARNKHAGATIPEILDANVWHEHAYIAMELLGGATLAARIAQGPIAWRRALFIAAQIAQALEAAHAEGVIHRDLKPQNVILADARRACVIDWGIARLISAPSPAPAARGTAPLPAQGDGTEAEPPLLAAPQRVAPIGTPGYIAPEIYDGAAPTAAADAFALGVVLYEMIAGRLPHAVELMDRTVGGDAARAFRTQLDRATQDLAFVPLRDRRPDVPRDVAALVDALLAPDPAARPTDLRAAIDRANKHPYGIPEPPFVGLGKLGIERAGLFFGQDDTVDHVLARLEAQRGVLLWGPSGSGKSSLAVAGVGAGADRRLFLDMDGWTVHAVRPRDREALRVAARSEPADPRIGHVVVIDQLEEIVDLEPAARDAFCAAALALLDGTAPVQVGGTTLAKDQTLRVIATIRDDLEWRVDREVPALRPLLERRVIVKGVDANFARSIIGEPARAAGYEVEELAAVAREVEDRLSADPAKLPVVQFALGEWWDRRDRAAKRLPIAAWRELGGVDGTLSFVAERFYSALAPDDQQRVKAIFVRFFGVRRLAVADVDRHDQRLVEELVKLRLIARRERKGTPPFYEVEHDALRDHWARLAAWLDEARDDRQLHDELERDAAGWTATHDPERLWKKRRLYAGEDLARRGAEPVSSDALAFLAAGRKAARRGTVTLVAGLGLVVIAAAIAAAMQVRSLSVARNEALEAENRADRERAAAVEQAQREQTARAAADRAALDAKSKGDLAEKAKRYAEEQQRAAKSAYDALVKAQDESTLCKASRDKALAAEHALVEKQDELRAALLDKGRRNEELINAEVERRCAKINGVTP